MHAIIHAFFLGVVLSQKQKMIVGSVLHSNMGSYIVIYIYIYVYAHIAGWDWRWHG